MKRIILGGAVAVMALTGVSAAHAADKYTGEFASISNCHPSNDKYPSQCWVDISKTGKSTYKVNFFVADALDAKKILCNVSFKMKPGMAEDMPNRRTRKGLVGVFGNNNVGLWSDEPGHVELVGGMTNDFVCKDQFMWSGNYIEMGD